MIIHKIKDLIMQVIAVLLFSFLMWFALTLVLSVPTWWLWNAILPPLFELPPITLVQALQLLLLTGCLFGARAQVKVEA